MPRRRPSRDGVSTSLDALSWRHVGPFRGGRVVAVAGDPVEDHVFYFGSTGGGVWKTTDAGSYWENVSDGFFRRASVGALAVAPSDRNVLYAGMGEACIRGNVSHGDGVYGSTDAGATWRHLGLADTRHIGKLRVDPRDAATVFVAALGHAHGPNKERGLYRSRDGGRSWQLVLSRGDRAGAVDVSFDNSNPRVVYAATWEAFRHPWIVSSGGPGSGIFRSTDGGDTWTDLSRAPGLPAGLFGRIGIVASPALSGRVFAIVENVDGGLFWSDDRGESWTKGSAERSLWYRGYYYQHVVADPVDPNTLWVLNQDAWRSIDGGRTFQRVATPHGDNHDLWIDPRDPRRMIVGCDGGAGVSFNGGTSWSSIYNQPTAELYHVATDAAVPYRVYGAQQDCGTVSLPSRSMIGAITNYEAQDVGGGECGYVAVRADDPAIVFSGQFNGYLTRFDVRTGQARNIEVWPEAQGWGTGAHSVRHRFTYSFPIVASPHDPNVVYVTGERVFRTTDEGTSWTAVSPDLTRGDVSRMEPSGAPIRRDAAANERERVCTIFTFAESPRTPGLLWAGTDDGLVHVSRDGGRAWHDVTPPGVAPWTLVSAVEPSPHDPAVAYVAATRYLLDDFRPMLFRTANFGRTWTKITNGIAADDFTRVIREDPVRPGLLFAGSETGVYASFDRGRRWHRLQGDLPVVPVHDLVIKDGDLVAATHGRGFWILDDLTPLRQDFERAARTPRLFAPRRVTRFQLGGRYMKPPLAGHNYRMEGFTYVAWRPLVRPGEKTETFVDAGRNPPAGAVIYYTLPRRPKGEVTLSFHDDGRRRIARFASRGGAEEPSPPKSAGLNRFIWDMRHEGAMGLEGETATRGADRAAPGPFVTPGRYEVRLRVDGVTRSATFDIATDPRTGVSQADLEAQLALLLRLRDATTDAHRVARDVRALRSRLDAVEHLHVGDRGWTRAARRVAAARARLDTIEREIVPPAGPDAFITPPALAAKLAGLSSRVASADAAPTAASLELAERLVSRVEAVSVRARAAIEEVTRLEASLATT